MSGTTAVHVTGAAFAIFALTSYSKYQEFNTIVFCIYITDNISSQIIEEWVNLPVTELSSGLLQSLVSDNTYFDFFGTLLYVLFWEFEELRLVFIASLFPAC